MKHTIIAVYEAVPDFTLICRLETDDDDLAEKVKSCHGKYGNATDTPEELNKFLCYPENFGEIEYDSSKAEPNGPINIGLLGPGAVLIHTGMFL